MYAIYYYGVFYIYVYPKQQVKMVNKQGEILCGIYFIWHSYNIQKEKKNFLYA